jgi:hypothetical protein
MDPIVLAWLQFKPTLRMATTEYQYCDILLPMLDDVSLQLRYHTEGMGPTALTLQVCFPHGETNHATPMQTSTLKEEELVMHVRLERDAAVAFLLNCVSH